MELYFFPREFERVARTAQHHREVSMIERMNLIGKMKERKRLMKQIGGNERYA